MSEYCCGFYISNTKWHLWRDGTWRDGPGWTTEGSRGKTTNFGIQEREDTLSNGSVNKRFPDLNLPSQFCDVWKHYQIRARTTEYGNEHVQVSYYWMRQKKRASFPCRVFIEYCEFFRREQTRKLCYCEFYGLSVDWLIFCVPRPGYAEEIHNTSGADSEAKWFTESKQTCPTATNRVTKNNVS